MERDTFKEWADYMIKKGYLNAAQTSLCCVRMAFEAGMDAGYYEGASFAAELEGCSWPLIGKPFWYAPKD